MPVAKFSTNGTVEATKSDEGNDSLDMLIRQAIGKEPLLSFSRTGDSPVQWIQLLHALDPQDVPGWPLLTTLKVQMQKCEKCSREFCSPVNYRRHIRTHRRSLNIDKESHKYRDLLGAFWDKLSMEEAKEAVSFKDVMLKEVPGSSVLKALATSLRKPAVWALPQIYVKAGSTLLDIIQAKPCRLPISSLELFTILDDASEGTFLCAGTAESVQKYVFDGDAGKVCLELKNLVACTCFLFEQKLIKAWRADKDAEALRCQKLLVEEEEAAQKRQAELLERKKQKKLRQKEQKAREQFNGIVTDLDVTTTLVQHPHAADLSSTPVLDETQTNVLDTPPHATSCLQQGGLSSKDDVDIEAGLDWESEHLDMSIIKNVEPQMSLADDHHHVATMQWQVPKSQRVGRNGFHGGQSLQLSKLESLQKHASSKDRGAVANSSRVWTRKVRVETEEENLRPRLLKEAINQTDQKRCEVIIGSISIPVTNCTQLETGAGEAHDCSSTEHFIPRRSNISDKPTKSNIIYCSTNRMTAKLWRPVSRHETKDPLPVHRGSQDLEEDIISEKLDDRTVSSERCFPSSLGNDDSQSKSYTYPLPERSAYPEGLTFSTIAAKTFLAERWKEAISSEHVKLVLSPDPDPLECTSAENDCPETVQALQFHDDKVPSNVEDQRDSVGTIVSSTNGNVKAKFRSKPDKGVKIKYIRKQRAVN